ncbi:MAG TPA: hypothetical protein GXX37_09615 [Clostridiaceae bacterium]|nr:hypothetical protein [Clostridiaceae bacterium]
MFFKSVANGIPASQAELDMMTDLVRRIREMLELEGEKKGEPILLSVRVPDSVEYCKVIGIDIEKWLSEGLIDIMVVSSYLQLNYWEYSVSLGHKYGVKVYPSLDEIRIPDQEAKALRSSPESYRGLAMNVWSSGADGVLLFNYFLHLDSNRVKLLNEAHDPEILKGLEKFYFASMRGKGGIAGGGYPHEQFMNIPSLNPASPININPGEEVTIPIKIGDDVKWGVKEKIFANIKLFLRFKQVPDEKAVMVKFNGNILNNPCKDSDKIIFDVKDDYVVKESNMVSFQLAAGYNKTATLTDLYVRIRYN